MHCALENIIKLQNILDSIKLVKERVKKQQKIVKTGPLLKDYYRCREDYLMNKQVLMKKIRRNHCIAIVGFKQLVKISIITHRNFGSHRKRKVARCNNRSVCHLKIYSLIQ